MNPVLFLQTEGGSGIAGFIPFLIIGALLYFVFRKEEKAFEKERKNPDRKRGFYKPPKMQTPSEIAQESLNSEDSQASQETKEEMEGQEEPTSEKE